MRTKLLLIAILAIVCLGCKTVKQTEKTNLQTNTAHNTTVKESNVSNLDVTSNFSKVERNFEKEWASDNSTVDETSDESTTITNFSAPDSIGLQYPTSTSTTTKHTHRGENKNVKKNAESNNSRDSKGGVSDKSDYKSDMSLSDNDSKSLKQKTDSKITEETKTPAWVYVVVFVLVLALIGFIYLALKRFGIIK